MYIDPFAAGALTVVFVEIAAVFAFGIWSITKGK